MCIFLEQKPNVIKLMGKINVFNDLKAIIEDYQTVIQ